MINSNSISFNNQSRVIPDIALTTSILDPDLLGSQQTLLTSMVTQSQNGSKMFGTGSVNWRIISEILYSIK